MHRGVLEKISERSRRGFYRSENTPHGFTIYLQTKIRRRMKKESFYLRSVAAGQ